MLLALHILATEIFAPGLVPGTHGLIEAGVLANASGNADGGGLRKFLIMVLINLCRRNRYKRRPSVGNTWAAGPGGHHGAVGRNVNISRNIKVDQFRSHFPRAEDPIQPGGLLLTLVMRRKQRKPALAMEANIGVDEFVASNTFSVFFVKVEVACHNEGRVIGASGDPLYVGQVQHGDVGGVRTAIVGNDPDSLM
eukprot:1273590-Amphidinium_carterae.1